MVAKFVTSLLTVCHINKYGIVDHFHLAVSSCLHFRKRASKQHHPVSISVSLLEPDYQNKSTSAATANCFLTYCQSSEPVSEATTLIPPECLLVATGLFVLW